MSSLMGLTIEKALAIQPWECSDKWHSRGNELVCPTCNIEKKWQKKEDVYRQSAIGNDIEVLRNRYGRQEESLPIPSIEIPIPSIEIEGEIEEEEIKNPHRAYKFTRFAFVGPTGYKILEHLFMNREEVDVREIAVSLKLKPERVSNAIARMRNNHIIKCIHPGGFGKKIHYKISSVGIELIETSGSKLFKSYNEASSWANKERNQL